MLHKARVCLKFKYNANFETVSTDFAGLNYKVNKVNKNNTFSLRTLDWQFCIDHFAQLSYYTYNCAMILCEECTHSSAPVAPLEREKTHQTRRTETDVGRLITKTRFGAIKGNNWMKYYNVNHLTIQDHAHDLLLHFLGKLRFSSISFRPQFFRPQTQMNDHN